LQVTDVEGERRVSSSNGTLKDANGIEVNGLVREFKGGVRAVDGIDFEVRPGEIYGFLGPNGAGKSTTTHMLTTLLPPTAGSARVAGHDVVHDGAAVRDAIGAALQEAALDPNLTARDHMRLQGALHGMPKAERTKRGDELIERVGLADAADRSVGGYSGGMKRRLDLALALLHGPRVLFLDEPSTGLDIQSRTALWDEVARLSRDDGVTIFLTTQYLEEADQLADHLGIIDHGKIVAAGTPEALKAEVGRPTVEVVPADHHERDRAIELLRPFGELVPGTPQGAAVRLDHDGGERLADIIRAFDQAGVKVANLELHEASLNDVFLTKTGRSLEGAQREAAEEGETGEQPAVAGAPA
jgi:ABC-2 type transport system ATP-binding protein